MIDYFIRAIEDSDRNAVGHILRENWGSDKIVSRGTIRDAGKLPGFIAFSDNRIVGIITYDIKGTRCEIVTLNSTTNDNFPAIRFYQKRGFNITSVHEGAIEKSCQLKPEIPYIGLDGIPIRDEIEMEIVI
jgi:hypothetical protein